MRDEDDAHVAMVRPRTNWSLSAAKRAARSRDDDGKRARLRPYRGESEPLCPQRVGLQGDAEHSCLPQELRAFRARYSTPAYPGNGDSAHTCSPPWRDAQARRRPRQIYPSPGPRRRGPEVDADTGVDESAHQVRPVPPVRRGRRSRRANSTVEISTSGPASKAAWVARGRRSTNWNPVTSEPKAVATAATASSTTAMPMRTRGPREPSRREPATAATPMTSPTTPAKRNAPNASSPATATVRATLLCGLTSGAAAATPTPRDRTPRRPR